MPQHLRSSIRFGSYQLNLASGELHKNGRRIRLAEQPFQILRLLLERPGEVVTREELHQRLWADDTFVDFETGLNSAVKKLRDTLGDSAEKPHFIETLPRRGYRFIHPIDHQAPQNRVQAAETPPTPLIRRRAMVYWVSAALVLFSVAKIWTSRQSEGTGVPPLVRFALTVPASVGPAFWDAPKLAFSPDGSSLAYVQPDRGALFVRPLDKLEGEPLAGGADASAPFFSPDGRMIGFFTSGKLLKLSVHGGVPTPVCDSAGWMGADWGPNNTIIFAPGWNTPIYRVPAAGGAPQPLTQLDAGRGENSHRWPRFLPGGKAILFTVKTLKTSTFDDAQIAVQALGGGPHRIVVEGGSSPMYVSPGYIIFARANSLLAMPFNLETLEPTGSAFTLLEGVSWRPSTGAAQYAVSANGSLAYVAGTSKGPDQTLVWVNRKGSVTPIPIPPQTYRAINVSPDGRLITASITAANDDIWIADSTRGTLTRLTAESGNNHVPIWTSDSKRVVFLADRGGIYWKAADASGDDELLSPSAGTPVSVSPDGRFLVYAAGDPKTKDDLWIVPLRRNATPQPLVRTPFNESRGVISPDGRWISYDSDTTGRREVYVRAFPGPGPVVQVSSEGGDSARWAHNGRELFIRNGKKMFLVPYSFSPGFTPQKPRLLFEGNFLDALNYGLTQDDQRFVMVQLPEKEEAARQLVIVVNWLEELKHRPPAK